MGKYESLANEIVKNVGSKENIISLVHCVTRLRFQLKDEGKANDDAIKNMDGVVTLMKSGGQYQIVIGNHVPEVFADVCEVAGIKAGASNQTDEKKKQSAGAVILDFISATINPTIGVLCASGMLKGILSIFIITGVMADTDGIYMLLNAASDALFYYFPIFLGYNAAAKLKMSPFLGAAIGAAMVYPSIQNLEGVSVFGIDISGLTYANTVIPVVLVVLVAAPLERFLKKVIPDVIKAFVVPMLVLVICVPLGFTVIGPVANIISNGLAGALVGAYGISPVLSGILLGGLWQVLVVFGIHGALVMVMIMDLMAGNPSMLMPMLGAASFAQTAVVFVIWLKTKDKKLKNIAFPAWISGIFGVTEPAIYGVTLPRIKYFIISCIGAALGGLYVGLTKVTMYQMAGMGIFSIPGVLSAEAGFGNLINFLIAIVIAMASSGIATYILFKDDKPVEEKTETKVISQSIVKISAPIAGDVIPLSEVKDEAFSQGLLGKGVAIEPKNGRVVAPEDGVLTTLFPTNHALGIKTNSGVEILIHIGMDTVQLEGKYFTPRLKQGDTIKKGQELLRFDMDAIKKAGYPLTTPVIITNMDDYTDVIGTDAKTVSVGDNLITVMI